MDASLKLAELGRALFYGIRRKRNYRKAFPLLLQAAKEGYVHWQYLVGYALDHGLGVKRDLRGARHWYAKAGRRGHPGALFNLALMYDLGGRSKAQPEKSILALQEGRTEGRSMGPMQSRGSLQERDGHQKKYPRRHPVAKKSCVPG